MLRNALIGLGVAVAFLVSLVVGTFVHLDMAITRAATRDIANLAFRRGFEGTLVVGDVEVLTPRAIVVSSFTADSPNGVRVLTVEGIHIGGDWYPRINGWLYHGKSLDLPSVKLDVATVDLSREGDMLAIAKAFEPPSETPEPLTPQVQRKRTRIALQQIEIGEIHVIGDVGAQEPLEGVLSDLRAGLITHPDGLEIHVDHLGISEPRVAGAPAEGTLDFHLFVQQIDGRVVPRLWGSFDGTLGDIAVSARTSFDDGELTAAVDVPEVGPDDLSPWIKESPLRKAVGARALVHGHFPHLQLEAEVLLPEPAALSVRGHMLADARGAIVADVIAEHLDAELFGQQKTDINGGARVHVRLDGPGTELLGYLRIGESSIDAQQLGPLEGTVRASQLGVTAIFRLEEDGAPTDIALHLRAGDQHVAFAARTEADLAAWNRLPKLLRRPGPTHGQGQLLAEGSYAGGELDVTTRAKLHDVRWPAQEVRLGHVSLDGRVAGPTDALVVDVEARGDGLSVKKDPVKTFAISARGPIGRPEIVATADLRDRQVALRAKLDADKRRANDVQVDVTHGNATVTTKVATVRAGAGGVALEGIEIGGLGSDVAGGLRIVGGEIFGKLSGDGIDLAAVSRVLGLPFRINGKVDLDVDLADADRGRTGHVSAKIHDAGYLVLSGINGELRADFDGERVTPKVELSLMRRKVREGSKDLCNGKLATVSVEDAGGTLDGALLDPAAWQKMAGSMRVRATDVNLKCVAEVWQQFDPTRELPFKRIEGILNASAILSRESRQRFLSIGDLEASTTALVYETRPQEEGKASVVSDQLDVVMLGALDGHTGHSDLKVHLIESATRTDLAQLSLTAELDLPALSSAKAQSALLDTELSASLRTKRRKIKKWAALPAPVRTQVATVEGDAELDVFVEGTLRDPSVAVRFRAWDLGHTWGLPTDVDVLANYHGGLGRLDAKVVRDGEDVAAIAGELNGDLGKRISGVTDTPWTGWASADLHGLPLETLPPLAQSQVRGMVTGKISVKGLGDKPKIDMHMKVPELRVGRVKFVGASIDAEQVPTTKGMYVANLRLPLSKGRGLEARAYGNFIWEDGLVPTADETLPAGLHVVAKRFPLASLEPALAGVATRVDGYLHGSARVRYKDLGKAKAAIDVNMKVVDGVVSLPGQELTEITATAKSKPSIIEVSDISITSHTGKATGKMTARLDGVVLTDVTGKLTAPADTPMPVILEGIPLGNASGSLVVSYTKGHSDTQPDKLLLSVADLELKMPASNTNKVQPLDDHPDIVVSHPMKAPVEDEEDGEQRRNIRVTIALDRAVLEKGQTRIVLSTATPLVVDTDGRLSGEIAVIGGKLNLLGKVFSFDRGIVRLRPDEKNNPYVNVTAKWSAPDGTIVYVDYVGLVKSLSSDKIRFRSAPPLSQRQILSLLLLGDTDTGADRAANLTRGIAAMQFNQLLGDIAPGLSTSFATTEGYIGTTLIYQLSDSVTARATVEQQDTTGSTNGGGDTDSAATGSGQNAAARTSVSIDWRFAPHWLLRGTIGVGDEASSGLDVLYQFRY